MVNRLEVAECQELATLYSQLAITADSDLIKRYIEDITPQMDGTMDALIPHFMGLNDMRKAQANARFIVGVLQAVLTIKELAEKQLLAEKR